jgi:hypothetical protein
MYVVARCLFAAGSIAHCEAHVLADRILDEHAAPGGGQGMTRAAWERKPW